MDLKKNGKMRKGKIGKSGKEKMKKKKIEWGKIALGGGIIAVVILDVVPGDEPVGIPLGVGLILNGLGYLK